MTRGKVKPNEIKHTIFANNDYLQVKECTFEKQVLRFDIKNIRKAALAVGFRRNLIIFQIWANFRRYRAITRNVHWTHLSRTVSSHGNNHISYCKTSHTNDLGRKKRNQLANLLKRKIKQFWLLKTDDFYHEKRTTIYTYEHRWK